MAQEERLLAINLFVNMKNGNKALSLLPNLYLKKLTNWGLNLKKYITRRKYKAKKSKTISISYLRENNSST